MESGEDVDTDHLEDVDDGCGCAEIWETMSDQRNAKTESNVADD